MKIILFEEILAPIRSVLYIKIHFFSENNEGKTLHFQSHGPNFCFGPVENCIKWSKENKTKSKDMVWKYYNTNGYSKLQNRYWTVKNITLIFFWILQQWIGHVMSNFCHCNELPHYCFLLSKCCYFRKCSCKNLKTYEDTYSEIKKILGKGNYSFSFFRSMYKWSAL